jgi:hypothetical protein
MSHSRIATTLAAVLLACACSGGGSRSGPTDPGPPPAPILGSWSGSLSVIRTDGSGVSCALTFDFTQAQQSYTGTYTVLCGESREDGVVGASLLGDQLLFNAVIRTASSAHPPLDACPWGGQLTENGTHLFGNWRGGGCNSSLIAGGSIDINRSGG